MVGRGGFTIYISREGEGRIESKLFNQRISVSVKNTQGLKLAIYNCRASPEC